jgi:hypothetical protein
VAEELAGIFLHLPQQEKANALSTILRMKHSQYGFKALAIPLVEWAKVQPDAAHLAWQDTLHYLSIQSRRDMLVALRELMPYILALVDNNQQEQVARQILEIIQKIGRWWP